MQKYSDAFKLETVTQYLLGDEGCEALAQFHGVDRSLMRRWVASYREHGVAGLSQKISRYSEHFKLSVLQHMWREALSYRQTAALFDIRSPASLGLWERQYHNGGLGALVRQSRAPVATMPTSPVPDPPEPPAPPDSKRTLEQLRQENEYLRAEVAYLKKLDALIQAKQAALKKRK